MHMVTVLKTLLGKNSQLGHAGSFTNQINNLKKEQKKTPKQNNNKKTKQTNKQKQKPNLTKKIAIMSIIGLIVKRKFQKLKYKLAFIF